MTIGGRISYNSSFPYILALRSYISLVLFVVFVHYHNDDFFSNQHLVPFIGKTNSHHDVIDCYGGKSRVCSSCFACHNNSIHFSVIALPNATYRRILLNGDTWRLSHVEQQLLSSGTPECTLLYDSFSFCSITFLYWYVLFVVFTSGHGVVCYHWTRVFRLAIFIFSLF